MRAVCQSCSSPTKTTRDGTANVCSGWGGKDGRCKKMVNEPTLRFTGRAPFDASPTGKKRKRWCNWKGLCGRCGAVHQEARS